MMFTQISPPKYRACSEAYFYLSKNKQKEGGK